MNRKEISTQRKLRNSRQQMVIKSNFLIQKTRYSLTVQEQKLILFLISKIKPEDKELKEQKFNLTELCDICGITQNGKNYLNFKTTILNLANKRFWVTIENKEVIMDWIRDAEIEPIKNVVTLKLDNKLRPYLLELRANFTQYQLEYILLMKSKYSIRLYELLKSYCNMGGYVISIDELKNQLQTAEYSDYKNFRVRVIDTAINEINKYTDIYVTYSPIRTGRKITDIDFNVSKTTAPQVIERYHNRKEGLYTYE